MAHHPYLFKGTVGDNVAVGLKLRGVPEAERRARLRAALSLVELDGWEKRSASALSAGQAQRVALARALTLRPRVLLLDEPTANLDTALGMRMEALLREVGSRNPDPELDLDYVPDKAREKDINIAISNSFAFGGNNTALVFGKWEG